MFDSSFSTKRKEKEIILYISKLSESLSVTFAIPKRLSDAKEYVETLSELLVVEVMNKTWEAIIHTI